MDSHSNRSDEVTERVAKMRDRINAGRAQSAVLKLRLADLSHSPAEGRIFTPHSPLFNRIFTVAMTHCDEASPPRNIPINKAKEEVTVA